jgi:hypothetical protein
MKVEDKPLTMPPAEKTEEVWHPENDFRTGILPVSASKARRARPPRNRPFFGRSQHPDAPRCHPSHAFCVGTLDLASVSPIVRSVSNSVRRDHPTVSANLHRKPPLIARRTVHHCAPLQLRLDDASASPTTPPGPPQQTASSFRGKEDFGTFPAG